MRLVLRKWRWLEAFVTDEHSNFSRERWGKEFEVYLRARLRAAHPPQRAEALDDGLPCRAARHLIVSHFSPANTALDWQFPVFINVTLKAGFRPHCLYTTPHLYNVRSARNSFHTRHKPQQMSSSTAYPPFPP